jgi:hypothetical protein
MVTNSKLSSILLGFLAVLIACQEKPAIYKADPKILKGEWILDSIKGKALDESNRIYFLDSYKFYKFSEYTKSYLIDSSLTYDSSFVYKGNQKKYAVLFVDSTQLTLHDINKRTLFYKRRRLTDLNESVNRFLSRVPYKLKINGYWTVVSFVRPDEYYDEILDKQKLTKGNLLYFSDDGIVKAFKSLADTTELFKYSYWIFPDEIQFNDYDLVIGNKLIELTDATLIFDSRNKFRGALYTLKKINTK